MNNSKLVDFLHEKLNQLKKSTELLNSTKYKMSSQQLPPGWELRFNPVDNRPYYFDHNTQMNHWNLPYSLQPVSFYPSYNQEYGQQPQFPQFNINYSQQVNFQGSRQTKISENWQRFELLLAEALCKNEMLVNPITLEISPLQHHICDCIFFLADEDEDGALKFNEVNKLQRMVGQLEISQTAYNSLVNIAEVRPIDGALTSNGYKQTVKPSSPHEFEPDYTQKSMRKAGFDVPIHLIPSPPPINEIMQKMVQNREFLVNRETRAPSLLFRRICREVFRRFDRNQDETLSISEINDYHRVLGIDAIDEVGMHSVRQTYECDRNGNLKLAGFTACLARDGVSVEQQRQNYLNLGYDIHLAIIPPPLSDQENFVRLQKLQQQVAIASSQMLMTHNTCMNVINHYPVGGGNTVKYDQFGNIVNKW